MNTFSKVLVVFILLLSVGFAVSQLMLHARRVDYQELYASAEQGRQDQKSRADLLETDLGTTKTELTTVRDELRDLEKESERETQMRDEQIAGLKEDKTRLEGSFDAQRIQITNLLDRIEEKNGLIDNLKAAEARVSASLKTELAKSEALQDDVRNKVNKIDALEGQMAELNMERQSLEEDKAGLEGILALLKERGVDIPPMKLPAIDAKVVEVDSSFGAVVINRGKNDGVKVAHSFTIFRDETALAKVTVVRVEDDHCVGQLEQPPGLFDNANPMRVGDNATTRVR